MHFNIFIISNDHYFIWIVIYIYITIDQVAVSCLKFCPLIVAVLKRSKIYVCPIFIMVLYSLSIFFLFFLFFFFQQWYALSKTLSEKVAWKFSRENGIDLVTLHPGVVIGPLLPPTVNSSVKLVLNQIDGIVYN